MSQSVMRKLFFTCAVCAFAEDDSAVGRWVKQRAISITALTPGHPSTADLASLKKVFKRAQVVGTGEATHGAHEFQYFKHRLFRFLVTEMGFNTFTIEGSYSGSKAINDYVVNGKGDRADVLSGQGYMA